MPNTEGRGMMFCFLLSAFSFSLPVFWFLPGADLFSAGGTFRKGLLPSSLSAGLSAVRNTALALLK